MPPEVIMTLVQPCERIQFPVEVRELDLRRLVRFAAAKVIMIAFPIEVITVAMVARTVAKRAVVSVANVVFAVVVKVAGRGHHGRRSHGCPCHSSCGHSSPSHDN